MDQHTSHELAYQNGYSEGHEKGYKEGFLRGLEDGKPKWISVKDRLPDNKEHDWVLAQVVEDNGFMHIPKVMEYRHQRNDWFEETYGWLSEHNGAFTVTHWMPLPSPPSTEVSE